MSSGELNPHAHATVDRSATGQKVDTLNYRLNPAGSAHTLSLGLTVSLGNGVALNHDSFHVQVAAGTGDSPDEAMAGVAGLSGVRAGNLAANDGGSDEAWIRSTAGEGESPLAIDPERFARALRGGNAAGELERLLLGHGDDAGLLERLSRATAELLDGLSGPAGSTGGGVDLRA